MIPASTIKTFLDSQHRISHFFPWLAGPLFFGLLAIFLGQDANWDLRNYHLYNPFAFLHHRLDFDMVPAQVATFYNPLLHIPFYWAVMALPPMLTGFLVGAVQGLNFPILVGIARSIMGEDREHPQWHYYLAAFIGLLGAGTVAEFGTTFGDNLVSLPLFGGLWLLLANFHRLRQDWTLKILLIVGIAGILTGMGAGLKQPSALFAVGWCAAFLVLPVPFWRRVILAFFFGTGVLGGIAITGGFWMYELWIHYGNPLFPYFNDLFRSSMGAIAPYRDTHFLPPSFLESLFLPFLIVFEPLRVGETQFRDLRFVLFIIMLIITALFTLRRSATASHPALTQQKGFFFLTAIVVSYVVWLRIFAIYRYLLPLEMLMPIAIWLLIDRFPVRLTARNMAILVCMAVWLITLQPGNWGRVSWGTDYFGVQPPALADPANTMVLMTGLEASSYVIPFFPASVRFVRIESYFTRPSKSPNGFDLLMQQLVADHQGPLYVLYRSDAEGGNKAALQHFDLQIKPGECQQLKSRIEEQINDIFYFCAVTPTDTLKNKRKKK